MSSMRGRLARALAGCVRALVPTPVADSVLADIEDAHRRRAAGSPAAADRWLIRQLLLTLRPARVRSLRAMGPGVVATIDEASAFERLRRSLGALGADLRYGARMLRNRPAQAVLTVSILGGGLAVSIFTWSFLHAVLDAPLPIPEGDRVVRVMAVRDGRTRLLDAADFESLRDRLDAFEAVGIYETRHLLVEGSEETRALYGTFIEPNMFDVAPVPPRLGRRLLPSDAEAGAEPVVVLSHRVWTGAFGAAPDIVDARVDLNGVSTRIVGVMPEGYGFPVFGLLWLPLDRSEHALLSRGERYPDVYGKLREGVTFEQANAELDAAIGALRAAETDPDQEYPQTAIVRTFQEAQLGDEAALTSWTLQLAAGLILLLACVNAGNLLLARGLERVREIRVRMALGAPRFRLVRQMMAEGALLAVLGGLLGLALAARALTVFDQGARAMLPDGLAYWWRWGPDASLLTGTALFVGLALLLVGGIPAWNVTRRDTATALRDDDGPGRGGGTGRIARLVVVLQIALIAVLLFLGGVASLVARRATDVDMGLDTEGVLLGIVSLPEDRYEAPDRRRELARALHDRMSASPAVEGVVLRGQLGGASTPLQVEGRSYESERSQPDARVRVHSGDPGVVGIRLRAGRGFDARDTAAGMPAAIVSESLAYELWPGASPLGRRLRIGAVAEGDDGPWLEVVGVVSDILEGNPIGADRNYDTLYLPLDQRPPLGFAVTFRHRGDVRAAITALHDALDTVDPEVLPQRVEDFEVMLDIIQRMSRIATSVLIGCFGFALLLAVGGIYGLTARSVLARIPEIGIRRALGATDRGIVGLLLLAGTRQLAIGLGLAAVVAGIFALAVSRFVDLDPLLWALTGVSVPTVIAAIVLVATWLPGRRAVRIPPREAIWRE